MQLTCIRKFEYSYLIDGLFIIFLFYFKRLARSKRHTSKDTGSIIKSNGCGNFIIQEFRLMLPWKIACMFLPIRQKKLIHPPFVKDQQSAVGLCEQLHVELQLKNTKGSEKLQKWLNHKFINDYKSFFSSQRIRIPIFLNFQ